MPINSAGYRKVDKLTQKEIPSLGPDEWIRLRGQRDSINDFYARAKAMLTAKVVVDDDPENDPQYQERALAPGEQDPDIVELEEGTSASREVLELHNGEFWFHVFDYLLIKFRVRDTADGEERWMDDKDPQDRRYLFMALGEELLPHLSERAGGTPTTDIKKPDGSPVEFPGGRTVGDSGNAQEVQSA